MRHSSWTVFLVPLALALAVLLLPGSTQSSNLTDSATGARYEHFVEESLSRLDATAPPSGSAEDGTGDTSEALYKD